MAHHDTPVAERADPDDPRWSDWLDVFAERTDFVRAFCRNKRVLDAPCGVGWTTSRVAEVAVSVEAIDYAEDAIEQAHSSNAALNVQYHIMNALELDFPDRSFDVAISLEGLEHFDPLEGRKYLGELNRVLRLGGVIVGSTPRAENKADARRRLEASRHRGHKHIYTERGLRRVLRRYFFRAWTIRMKGYCLFLAVKHCEPLPLLPEAWRHQLYLAKEALVNLFRRGA